MATTRAEILGAPDSPAPANRGRILKLALALALALAAHLALLSGTRVNWTTPVANAPVEIQPVDPAKLDAIRRQWSRREQRLLLDTDRSRSKTEQAPKDARYFSDRNIRVEAEKEQRARDTAVIPKPGSEGASTPAPPRSRSLPDMARLGVPIPFTPQQQRARGGPRGGQQYVEDRELPLGGENLLNAQESVYYSFYARLYEAIGPLWESRVREASGAMRLAAGDYTTVADVVFDSDGSLREVRILRSSQIPAFDDAARTSWQRIGRFPNPPSALVNARGEVHTGWTFTVKVGGGGFQYLPPERVY